MGDLFHSGSPFCVLALAGGFHRLQPRGRHCPAQVRLAEQGRDIAHPRPLRGVIDLHGLDPLQRVQGLFQPASVIIVAHAADDQIGLAGGDIVTRLPHPSDQAIEIRQARVEFDRGALGGQVHHCLLHALHFFQVSFDRRDAVGAGHPGYGQGHLLNLWHGAPKSIYKMDGEG